MIIDRIRVSKLFDEAPYDFLPTGSRHFGGFREDSDWDFIASYSDNIMAFLYAAGFEVYYGTEHDYAAPFVEHIMQNTALRCHVIVVKPEAFDACRMLQKYVHIGPDIPPLARRKLYREIVTMILGEIA